MTDDAELLRRYAESHDEDAFAELVRSHLSLVYHAALRQCGGDAHRAEDVAQVVFTDLARKARRLAGHAVLAGWLYTSTRYAASQAVRTEARRQAREQEVHAMNELLAEADREPAAEWERLRPVIDDALHALGERDREAVLLRFFEGRAFADVGAKLSVSEDAARIRVARALERLRNVLARRGLTSTTAVLSLALANQAAATVPEGVAASVTGAALAKAAVGSAFAAISFMSMNTVKITIATVVVLAGAGGLVWQQQANRQLHAEIEGLQRQTQDLVGLRTENSRLIQARHADEDELTALRNEIATLKNRVAQEAARSAAPAAKPAMDAKPAVVLATGLKPAASFTNAGRQTPRAALETSQWAINGGNVDVITQGLILPPAARQKAEEVFAKLPADKQAEYGTPEQLIAMTMAGTTQVAGMQVMSEKPGARTPGFDPALADDPTYRTLHTQTQYFDGRVRENDVVFQQTPDGWRTVFPAAAVAKVAEMLKPVPKNFKHDGGG